MNTKSNQKLQLKIKQIVNSIKLMNHSKFNKEIALMRDARIIIILIPSTTYAQFSFYIFYLFLHCLFCLFLNMSEIRLYSEILCSFHNC